MYQGDFATVNSFIFSNGRSRLALDVQRKPKEARVLIDGSGQWHCSSRRRARSRRSREQAMREMMARYPGYKQANFFLKYSLENHIKPR